MWGLEFPLLFLHFPPSQVTSAWWKTFSALDPETKSSSASLLEEGLAWMEGELEGRDYFARDAPEGGRPGLVDYKMWPW